MSGKKWPPKKENLLDEIKKAIKENRYRQRDHALQRSKERGITLPDAIYVLENGYHEARKDTYNEPFNTLNYAIRGLTVDEDDVRVIVSFDEKNMLIITVMYVESKRV
jgi:hypothetical protein